MKITMISNYINHHQIPFSDEMYKRLGDDYCFIQTEPMEEERSNMGWGVDEEKIPYLKLVYEDEEECRRRIMDCDLLIAGWQDREDLILPRMKAGKLTLRSSERLYREGQWKAISPRGLVRKFKEHTRFRNSKSAHLLCAGAYVPSDFNIVKAYPGKMYKFGYFPEFRPLDYSKKPPMDTIEIIWAGRFMPLKHPEFVVRLAADLVDDGYNFHIHMVGNGELDELLKEKVKEAELEDLVSFYGFLKPQEVRELMDTCHIHLFTSNYLEGWGAVVNEGMNSGLAEVVNSEVGAAPFLIKHEKNGLIYREGSYEDFREQVYRLMEDHSLIEKLGKAAYETIETQWNPAVAAQRIIEFYENYQKGEVNPPEDGPLSIAPVVAPENMYRYCMRNR